MITGLNLGCGTLTFPDCHSVDISALVNPDFVHDLNVFPWPFESDRYERVYSYDIFEHIDDPIKFMAEIHRVMKVGGKLEMKVNYWRSENAFTDPTHKRFCTVKTFDYWDERTEFGKKYPHYAGGRNFHIVRKEPQGEELFFLLEKV